ncbi:MAG: nucleotidyltransferase family protein, partial [Verrucomicrobiota bacterium]
MGSHRSAKRAASVEQDWLEFLVAENHGRKSAPPTSPNVDALHELAAYHRLLPVVGRSLGSGSYPWADQSFQAKIARFAHKNAQHSLMQARELVRITRAFEERNLPFLVLKGLPLSLKLHNELSSRVSKDIDLWVSGHDMETAHELLEEMGRKSDKLCQLRVHGLTCTDEDVQDSVLELIQENLMIPTAKEIDFTARLLKSRNGQPKPTGPTRHSQSPPSSDCETEANKTTKQRQNVVIVRFHNAWLRRQVYSSKKNLKNSGIFISEDLPKDLSA